MSESDFPPFLKWGDCKSQDENNPDILDVEVLETDTFETEYGINVRAKVNGIDCAIPLHNYNSVNKKLLQFWLGAVKSGKIQVGKKFKIITWLGISKNKRSIRRYKLEF